MNAKHRTRLITGCYGGRISLAFRTLHSVVNKENFEPEKFWNSARVATVQNSKRREVRVNSRNRHNPYC